jgi:hypothetical protein
MLRILRKKKKNFGSSRQRWLTPMILATQEAEIKTIEVQSQPGEIVLKILSWKKLFTEKD